MVLEEMSLPGAPARRWLVAAAGALLATAAVVAIAPPHAAPVAAGAYGVHLAHSHPR